MIETITLEQELEKTIISYPKEDADLLRPLKEELVFPIHGSIPKRFGDIEVNSITDWNIKECLAEYIKKNWDNREQLLLLVNDEKFTPKEYFVSFEDTYEKRIEPFTRIIKYLQSAYKPRCGIAEDFGTSRNTIDAYLNDLRDGVDILGKHISLKPEHGTNHYDPSIHPIFLTLNLSEVVALTVGLKHLFRPGGELENYPFNNEYLDIADDVYSQLSEYAKGMVEPHKSTRIRFKKPREDYRREREGKDYFLKSPGKCLLLEVEGYDDPLVGHFASLLNEGSIDFETEEGTKISIEWNKIISAREFKMPS